MKSTLHLYADDFKDRNVWKSICESFKTPNIDNYPSIILEVTDVKVSLSKRDDSDKPYINAKSIGEYNPNYGDNRICECGHTYDCHFDSYEDMWPCGCKYCGCNEFKEKKGANEKERM
jgi:hypothetical protein